MFLAYVENFCFLAGESQLSTWKRLSELIGVDRSVSEWIGADRRDRSGSELIGVYRSVSEWIGAVGVDRSGSVDSTIKCN